MSSPILISQGGFPSRVSSPSLPPRLDPENRRDARPKASGNGQETGKAGTLTFAGFVLDRNAGRLLGPDGEVRLRPQAFRLLEVLVDAAPGILSQDDLLDRAWGVEHLSPASVKQAVSEIRQALGDDPVRPSIIETVHRRGYRMIAPVATVATVETPVRSPDLSTPPIPGMRPDPDRNRPAGAGRFRVRRRLLLAAAILAAGALGAASRLLPIPGIPEMPTASGAAASGTLGEAAAPRPAIAILGFKNLSADPQDDWLSGALSELLAFELTAAGRVRLIPAENVAWMKRELKLAGAENPSRSGLDWIARNLGTDLVLTGSYLKEERGGLRLQVLVQDARSGETVAWSREAGTREALAALASAVSRGLQASLAGPDALKGTEAARGPLADAAALAASGGSLRLYAEGLERLRNWDAATALILLEKAAALDPRSPFIQDALAGAAFDLGLEAKAKEAARRAVERSAGLPPQVRLAIEARSREIHGDWAQAASLHRELRRAFPDDLEHGLRLARAQLSAGQVPASLATIAGLRRAASPVGEDPRLDLIEGDAHFRLGEYRRALESAERGIAGAERRGMAQVAASGRLDRAWALTRLGRNDEAMPDFATAKTLYLRTGDRGAAAGADLGRAALLQSAGRTGEAWAIFEEVIPTLRALGDRRREARALNNFASVLSDEGGYDGMAPLLERSLEIKREIGDRPGTVFALVGLANLQRTRGDLRSAHRTIEEALELGRSLDDPYARAYALRAFARVLTKEGRFDEARSALEETIQLTARMGDGEGSGEARLALGDLESATGRPAQARAAFEQALADFRGSGQTGDAIFTVLRLGGLSQEEEIYEEARRRFTEALLLARKIDNDFYAAHSHVGLAEVAALTKRPDVARAEYRQALTLWEQQKNPEEAEKAKTALAGLS